MRRSPLVWLLAAACAGGLAAGPLAGAASPARCPTGALRMRLAAGPPAKTMQHPALFALVNRGANACALEGYPRIRLHSVGGTRYPFAYRDGGDQEVTASAPTRVTLRAGATAWVLINKNTCVLNNHGRIAREIDLAPPGSGTSLHLPLASAQFGYDYCPSPDPGHRIEVSPVEPTVARTLSLAR